MTTAWFTKHRRALLTTLAGIALILAGRYAHTGLTYNGWQFGWVTILRILLIGVGVVVALSVVGVFTGALSSATGNGKASLGQGMIFTGLLWVASDKADLDWRAIRWTAVAFIGLVVCALLPGWVWENSVYVGLALLLGQLIGLLWVDLFTATPRWAKWLPEPKAPVTETRGAYWRDAKAIRKGWDKLMQKIAASTEDGGHGKAKMPKLVADPTVTQRVISMVIEPPAEWNRNNVARLAGVLTNEWNGVQSQVREETADRMSRRRMRIDVAMEPLLTSIPYPDHDREYGVPLGVGLMGDVLRLEVGSRGVPHVLVAGQAGSGKSSAMRVMGLGLVARGARVRCIDPKGEGDLEGISSEPTLYRPAEWTEWFDYLWDEQQRRAALKREGLDPGPPIVTMIDELAQIATKMGARDKKDADDLVAAHQAYMRLIFIGRGTGLHIISATQQASAQNLGGKDQGTAIRAQHLGRILFGRASEPENRKMVLGDRLVTEQDMEKMQEAPPGRAWVSGMTPRDTGLVHCVQFFDVPEMAGVPVFDRPTPQTAEPDREEATAGSGEADALRYLVADAVHTDGPQPRSVLCDRFGVPVTTVRHALRKAEGAGWVRVESPGGNAPVVVHPVGDWPPQGR